MAKKKILLMSDDLRMHSGVATVSKDIVLETLNEYDWVLKGVRSLICPLVLKLGALEMVI
mgnify:CR=1 FL=1